MPGATLNRLIEESSGNIISQNCNNNPLLLKRGEVNALRNYYYTQNGAKARNGSDLFKSVDNYDEDIDGNVIYMEVFSRDEDDFYVQFLGTDTGYLYFCRYTETGGDTTQTKVNDLTVSDYPIQTMQLDLTDDTILETELDRVQNYQYAIMRSPTATQGGAPLHWQKEPAFISAPTKIQSAVLNNRIYFIDSSNTLYMFDGNLTTGRKLTAITITKTEYDSADKFIGIFTFNNRLWVVTDTDKFLGSAAGDGTTFNDASGVYLKLGRMEGMDVTEFLSTKNGVFVGLTNPTIKRSSTKILTGNAPENYRLDDIDSEAGVIGSSGQSINQDFMALTRYGFVSIESYGSNDRFGLTKQDTMSSKVNNEILPKMKQDKIESTYYAGDKNWYVCKINDNTLAIYDVEFSTKNTPKWTFFDYEFTVRKVKSMVNRLFMVDNNNNILITDAPHMKTDNGTSYTKRIKSFAFGKGLVGRDDLNELIGIEKQFKDIAMVSTIPAQVQTVEMIPIYDGVPLTVNPKNTPIGTVELRPKSNRNLTLESTVLLSSSITLGSFEYETLYRKISSLAGTGRTLQIEMTTEAELDIEIIGFTSNYSLNKLAHSSNNTTP